MPETPERWPVIPMRDMVVFPRQRAPFIVGRPSSVEALETALAGRGEILLLMQRDPDVREPGADDVFAIGTVARIVQQSRQPDGTWKLLVEGLTRARIVSVQRAGPPKAGQETRLLASLEALPDREPPHAQRLVAESSLRQALSEHARLPGAPSLESSLALLDSALPGRACDDAAARLPLSGADKQRILEADDPLERMARLEEILLIEAEKWRLDHVLQRQVQRQVDQAQREYLLNEKLKAIHKELGRKSEAAEAQELLEKAEAAGMPQEAKDRVVHEIRRLEAMPAMSAEASVVRSYVEWMLALPWERRSEEQHDFALAAKILDEDHHGLEKIKERILEFLAVRALKAGPGKGSILCFVGPPGVGKTSLGRSIARATGREFARVSLGGVRDEAEIRGHRRTYVGAYPGRVIQMLRRAGTKNPVVLLDEVDKLASDFRGDPTSALLEVLDPEQNATFADHYLDTPFDLSEVLFLCTANVLQAIPDALRDRLEIIRLPGYTPSEKRAIAEAFLLPRQLEECGLKPTDVRLSREALDALIDGWTREAGVRGLERELASLCRKAAARIVRAGTPAPRPGKKPILDIKRSEQIAELLGAQRFRALEIERSPEIGVATGLAWTEAGGQVLLVEATRLAGKGNLVVTGRLGDVMQESLKAAVTWVRSRADRFNLPEGALDTSDFHVHLPEGAIPKDGPSAGITMALAVLSAITGRPVRHDIAMTGEITLRGRVLAVGGIKEKLLAAHRAGVRAVVLPADNARDLEDVPAEVRDALTLTFVSSMEEVVDEVLLPAADPAASLVRDVRASQTRDAPPSPHA